MVKFTREFISKNYLIPSSIFSVDSSEIAFLLCGHGCMKQVYDNATKSILEPVMSVEVTYPNEFDQRVTMLLMDRHVDIDETETDYLVRLQISIQE